MKTISEIIYSERDKGNVCLYAEQGLHVAQLNDIVEQPADGLLYDLNLLEETADFDTSGGINDFATALIIRKLMEQRDELRNR